MPCENQESLKQAAHGTVVQRDEMLGNVRLSNASGFSGNEDFEFTQTPKSPEKNLNSIHSSFNP